MLLFFLLLFFTKQKDNYSRQLFKIKASFNVDRLLAKRTLSYTSLNSFVEP